MTMNVYPPLSQICDCWSFCRSGMGGKMKKVNSLLLVLLEVYKRWDI